MSRRLADLINEKDLNATDHDMASKLVHDDGRVEGHEASLDFYVDVWSADPDDDLVVVCNGELYQ